MIAFWVLLLEGLFYGLVALKQSDVIHLQTVSRWLVQFGACHWCLNIYSVEEVLTVAELFLENNLTTKFEELFYFRNLIIR